MNGAELAEYLTYEDHGGVYQGLLILDYDDDRLVWWACSLCGVKLPDDGQGCPEHAPRDIPGLDRVECEATPPHSPMWTLSAESYGNPCPQCMYSGIAADLAKANKTDRCYHWPWRRWGVTRWLSGKGYALGVFASGGGTTWGGGHERCLSSLPRLRGERQYFLGVPRDVWRCWLRGRHRRGEPVGFGRCGKCVPWTCCGSERETHADGCAEDSSAWAVTR